MRIHRLALAISLLPVGLAGALGAQDAPAPPAQQPPSQQPMTHDEVLALFKESLPFDVHGGVWLWHYQPFVDGVKNNSEIYYANLLIDTSFDKFGYHFEPRFRDTKLRQYYESNVWIQENYLSWHPTDKDGGVLKAGKIYSQFGRAWDGVFYGNIPYFDGVKLDPDIGTSWEQHLPVNDTVGIDYSAQYFTRDGSTNGSLQGRDTVSIGTERNIVVGRVAPTFKLGADTSATVGVSGMHFDADLTAPAQNSSVTRGNVEASLTTGGFTVFGDFTHQHGNHVVDFPLPGSTSSDIDYLMSGVSYQWDDWTLRYSYSFGDYKDDDVKEDLHLPGVVYQLNKNISIWLEYVYWNRDTSGNSAVQDRSLNLMLYASF